MMLLHPHHQHQSVCVMVILRVVLIGVSMPKGMTRLYSRLMVVLRVSVIKRTSVLLALKK